MREILFRGKRVGNGEWAEGCYIYHHKEFATKEMSHFIIDVYGGYRYRVIPETVGEYTGKVDKNGKKIFEGDILKVKFRNTETLCVVTFRECWFIGISNGWVCEFRYMLDVEVIGNIYDNPELLDKENEK